MTRDTSIQAYHQIQAGGLLSRMRWAAYDALYQSPAGMTGHELNKACQSPDMHKRLSELLTLGVAKTVGERPCTVTGRMALVWDVTSALPVKKMNRFSNKARIQSILRKLVEEIESGTVSKRTLNRAKELCE